MRTLTNWICDIAVIRCSRSRIRNKGIRYNTLLCSALAGSRYPIGSLAVAFIEKWWTGSLAVATIARWWIGWLDFYRDNPPRGRGGYARAVATESLVSEKKDKQGLLVGLRLYGFRIRSLICSKT